MTRSALHWKNGKRIRPAETRRFDGVIFDHVGSAAFKPDAEDIAERQRKNGKLARIVTVHGNPNLQRYQIYVR